MNNLYTTVEESKSVWHAITRLDLPRLRAIPVTDSEGHYKALLHYSAIAQNFVDILSAESDLTTQTYLDEKLLNNISVLSMADKEIPAVHKDDSLGKVRQLLSVSPIRRLPVVDEDNKVIALISEHDLVRDANIDIILVDHNEQLQAVPGVENYQLLEVLDHHKVSPMSTTSPITFINRPIGSTSSIVTMLYNEKNIPIPRDIAGVLLSGLLSDTLILQSATTTEIDKTLAKQLADIAKVDIERLGHEILEAGSHIKDKTAKALISQDCKEYREKTLSYSISQIEVSNLGEVLDRKEELMAALENERVAGKMAFCALLVTDITQLSSILLISAEERLAPFITFPKLERDVYWLKNVVSRKKQLIPLVLEMIAAFNNNR